jgi:hypothetical protein
LRQYQAQNNTDYSFTTSTTTTTTEECSGLSPNKTTTQNNKRLLDFAFSSACGLVEIDEVQKSTTTNLLHKFDKFKKPVLTEHQKEVRKQNSFLPIECKGLDMDSQMSFRNDCDDSMQSQSMIVYPSQHEQQSKRDFSRRKSMQASISITDQGMDLDNDDDDFLPANMDLSASKKKVAPKSESPTPPSPSSPPPPPLAPTSAIVFPSKLNPNEDKSDYAKNASPASSFDSVSSSFGVAGGVFANNVVEAKPDLLLIAQELPSSLTHEVSEVTAESSTTAPVRCGLQRLRNNREVFNFYMNNKKRKVNTPITNTNTTTTTQGKPKLLRHNFKNKINKFSTSSGMTFKEKLNHGQKLAKYKRLIRNLKTDKNKNDEIFKNSQALDEIKEERFNLPASVEERMEYLIKEKFESIQRQMETHPDRDANSRTICEKAKDEVQFFMVETQKKMEKCLVQFLDEINDYEQLVTDDEMDNTICL